MGIGVVWRSRDGEVEAGQLCVRANARCGRIGGSGCGRMGGGDEMRGRGAGGDGELSAASGS